MALRDILGPWTQPRPGTRGEGAPCSLDLLAAVDVSPLLAAWGSPAPRSWAGFEGLDSQEPHLCTSRLRTWGQTFSTVQKGDPDSSVQILDVLCSLSSELCHDFPRGLLVALS